MRGNLTLLVESRLTYLALIFGMLYTGLLLMVDGDVIRGVVINEEDWEDPIIRSTLFESF